MSELERLRLENAALREELATLKVEPIEEWKDMDGWKGEVMLAENRRREVFVGIRLYDYSPGFSAIKITHVVTLEQAEGIAAGIAKLIAQARDRGAVASRGDSQGKVGNPDGESQ